MHLQYARPAFFVLFAGLLFLGIPPCLLEAAPPVRIMPLPQVRVLAGSAEDLYARAKTEHERLEQNGEQAQSRDRWLACVRQFRRVQLMRKNEELTANSLFMQGRLYRQMFEHFRMPLDLDNAIDSFYDVAASYPANSLADDALYYAAEASLMHPAKKVQAPELLHKIVNDYPGGDHAGLAADLLHRLNRPPVQAQAAPPSGPPPPAARPADTGARASVSPAASPAPPSQEKARVQQVKHWSSDDYTRIVIPATRAVAYTHRLLEKKDGMPPRLLIDFADSLLAKDNKEPVAIGDGLLRQVRSGQYTMDTVRVVLDIESISDYKIFSLPDPFRVIVDVRGVKTVSRPRPEAPRSRPSVRTALDAPAGTLVRGLGGTFVAPGAPRPGTAPSQTAGSTASTPEAGEEQTPAGIPNLTEQKKWAASGPEASGGGKAATLSLAQQLGLGVHHIVIDPGHGGKDPGAMDYGVKEKDVVLRLARIVAGKLQEQYGYQVSFTRNRDIFIPLEERTAIANAKKADLFLSLHANANSDKRVGGVETYYLNLATDAHAMRVAARENATSTRNIGELQDILRDLLKNAKIDESSKLAHAIQASLSRGLKQKYNIKNLGVKQAPFFVLIGAEMPAVLVEISFITNRNEARLMQNPAYLEQIATGIAQGLNSYVQHHHSASLMN